MMLVKSSVRSTDVIRHVSVHSSASVNLYIYYMARSPSRTKISMQEDLSCKSIKSEERHGCLVHVVVDYAPGNLAIAEVKSALVADLPSYYSTHFTSVELQYFGDWVCRRAASGYSRNYVASRKFGNLC